MKLPSLIKSILLLWIFIFQITSNSNATLPSRVLVGYWQNWNNVNAPFIKLRDVDSRYNVINLSFFEAATAGDINTLTFSMTPGIAYYQADLISDIALMQGQGKTILMSIGGASGSFRLTSTADKDNFVARVKTMIQTFGVDGIDIDLETQSYVCSNGSTITSPTDVHVTNMIAGLNELLNWYQSTYSKKMILTMAPETVYVQGGMSTWAVTNACGGSYLPIIHALSNDIDLMMVQLYNSGSMYGIDGNVYNQGSADFIVSQTEAVIKGFNCVSGMGTYLGLPASKVVVALPACNGSGYASPTVVKQAIDYLMGNGTKPGSYTLAQVGGYPDLRGMMDWSINKDATATCTTYSYAANFQSIFGSLLATSPKVNLNLSLSVTPTVTLNDFSLEVNQPSEKNFSVIICDLKGNKLFEKEFNSTGLKTSVGLSLQNYPSGLYLVGVQAGESKNLVKVVKE